MKPILAVLITVCRLLVLASMLLLMTSVTIQIFSRTFLPTSPIWTEELTRYSLLYMVSFGAGLSLLSGDMVNVDLALELMHERPRRLLVALGLAVTAVFAGFIVRPAYEFARIGGLQTSPSMGISMIWVYFSMVVLPLLVCVFALVAAIRILRTGQAESGKVGE